ncbi:MAG: phenylacetate--CoA ligase family protein [Deltaproteobacteria bacterium]|nr:MAG: phenylacetate--CoA ligase family protein [Deltaproteobacteria bacterium]
MGVARTFVDCLRLRYHDRFSPEKLQRFQIRLLRRLVAFAKKNSPFYAKLYSSVDPHSDGFSPQSLPPVTKEMLMENFDDVVTDGRINLKEVMEWVRRKDNIGDFYLSRYIVTHTSGTTGTPAYFVYDKREWDMIQALGVTRGMRYKPGFFELLRHAGRVLVRPPRIALVSVLGGHFVTYLLFRITPALARRLSRFLFVQVTDPVDSIVARLNDFQPNILHIYPTMLEVLAHEKLEGRLQISPWAISTSSEPLTPNAARIIKKAFPDSRLFETYGTTEGVTLACGCSGGEATHINSDYYVLEPVMEDGSPAEAGRAADRVYMTCLFARTMPLIRYELSDVTIPLDGECPCGLSFPRLKVRGRTDDVFWVDGPRGEHVALPPIPLEAMLLEVEGLRQYQVVQEGRNELRVAFIPQQGFDADGVRRRIEKAFESFLGLKELSGVVRVRVEQVKEIERDPESGKIRQIYSKVGRPFLPGRPLGDRRTGEDRRTRQNAVEPDRRKGERRKT